MKRIIFSFILTFPIITFSQQLLKDIGSGNGNTEITAFESLENNSSTDSLAFVYQNGPNSPYYVGIIPSSLDTVYTVFSFNSYDFGKVITINHYKNHYFVLCHKDGQRKIYRFNSNGVSTLIDRRNELQFNAIQLKFIENSNGIMLSESFDSNSFLISINENQCCVNLLYTSPGLWSINTPTLIDNIVFFGAVHPSYGQELYRSDGTNSGTYLVKDITPGTAGSGASAFYKGHDGVIRFFARDDNVASGYKLFRTDGTTSGTQLVFNSINDFNNLTPSSKPIALWPYVFMSNSFGRYLSYNLTNNTLTDIFNKEISLLNHTYFNGKVYLIIQENIGNSIFKKELWQTDGTVAGTMLLKQLYSESSYSSSAQIWNNSSGFFIQIDNISSGEIKSQIAHWFSDGTTNGTKELINTNERIVSRSRKNTFGVISDHLVLNNHYKSNGFEWLKASAGPETITLINDHTKSIYSSNPRQFFNDASTVYFMASDNYNGRELWQTDGTKNGTQLKFDGILYDSHFTDGNSPQQGSNDFAAVDDGFFYVDYGSRKVAKFNRITNSSETLISNFNTHHGGLIQDDNSYIQPYFIPFKNGVLFSNYSFDTGIEPWFSDGTLGGTIRLGDLFNGNSSSQPTNFMPVNNNLAIFSTHSPIAFWKTDGTAGGTQLIENLPNHFSLLSNQKPMVRDNKAYFQVYNYTTNKYELIKVDQTSLTSLVGSGMDAQNPALKIGSSFYYKGINDTQRTIYELNASDQIIPIVTTTEYFSKIIDCKEGIYFTMPYNSSWWLYKLVGNTPTRIKEISTNYPEIYKLDNDRFMLSFTSFNLEKSINQRHFIFSDGTESGTKELWIYEGNSSINDHLFFKNSLYFNFTTETSGSELWKLDLSCPESINITESSAESSRFHSSSEILVNTQLESQTELVSEKRIEFMPGTLIYGALPIKAEIKVCDY